MSSVIQSPIRPVSAGVDDERPYAYGLTRFPNGLYALMRLDLVGEGPEWEPCCHAMHEEVVRDGIERWTGLSVPLWWIRDENRTEAP
jgi:hypothetical protein